MKIHFVFKFFAATCFVFFLNSCATQSNPNGSTPQSVVQNTLNTGLKSAHLVFSDTNKFLTNALVEAVMPEDLKKLNTRLETMGLQSVVEKEKAYIAAVAQKAIIKASPIVQNSINNITPADAVNLLAGGKTAATDFLRNSLEQELAKSLTPLVDAELNKLGLTHLLNSSLITKASSLTQLAGSVFGVSTQKPETQINKWVTQQLVNGIFVLVEEQEIKARSNLFYGIQSIITPSGGQQ